MRRSRLCGLVVVLDACSSLGCLVVGKLVFRDYGFPYATLLTSIHLFFLSLALAAGWALRLFRVQRMNAATALLLGVLLGGATALNNLSLLTNSVTMHLFMKVLLALMLDLLGALTASSLALPNRRSLLAVGVICCGVLLSVKTDLERTALGVLTAFSAEFVRWVYDRAVDAHVSEHALGTPGAALLLYQAPVAAVLLLLVAAGPDNLPDNLYVPCTDTIAAVLFSAILVTTAWLTPSWERATTAPRAQAILGHGKLFLGLLLGIVFFDNVSSRVHYAGGAAALLGALALPLP